MEKKKEKTFWILQKISFELILSNFQFYQKKYLSSGVNTLTNSLKIWDTTKKKIIELKFFQIGKKIWQNYCLEDSRSVLDTLTCWLSIRVLTLGFLGV